MTQEQAAALEALFSHGWNREEASIRINSTLRRPDQIPDTRTVELYDQSAARALEEMTELTAQLEAYRIALSERYNQLVIAPTVPFIRLERHRKYSTNKVIFYLIQGVRYLDDGHEVKANTDTFPGTERRKAIATYHQFVKSHPGIAAEMDIAPSPWER